MEGIIEKKFWIIQSLLLWTNKPNIKQIWNNKRKYVNYDEWRCEDALQISHGQMFTISGIIVKLSIVTTKLKASFETSASIR